jgi:hypothetical protein
MLFRKALLCLPWMMSLTAADCWKNGAEANQEIGKSSVKDLSVSFQGYFADSQMRYSCWSDYASGNSYIYTIKRTVGYGGATLDIVDINDWLYREASACRYGGKSTHGGWEVK